jgi:drug/metabolite transporter (DMT)-like permease
VLVVAGLGFALTGTQTRAGKSEPGASAAISAAAAPATDGQPRWRTPFWFGVLSALLATIAYGTTTVLARHIVTTTAPAQVTSAFSVLFGMLFMFGVSAPNLREDLQLPLSRLWRMVAAGVFSSLAVLCYFTALTRLPVSVASPIVQLKTLSSIGIAHLFLKRLDRVTPRLSLGAMLVVVGVVLVILGRA